MLLAWLILCRHQCSCYASVNSSCAQPPSPPPPGYCKAFARLVSPGGVGHLQILHCPGTGHLPTPGPLASFWHARSFLSEYNYTEGFTGKKQTGSPVKDRNKLKRIVKACSRFYAYISSLLIKPELHSENRKTIDVNQRVLLLNQISVDIIWRTFFHIYITIHNI